MFQWNVFSVFLSFCSCLLFCARFYSFLARSAIFSFNIWRCHVHIASPLQHKLDVSFTFLSVLSLCDGDDDDDGDGWCNNTVNNTLTLYISANYWQTRSKHHIAQRVACKEISFLENVLWLLLLRQIFYANKTFSNKNSKRERFCLKI